MKGKVYLNGWLESKEYMINNTNYKYIGETKSYCGYYIIECYETI